MNHSRFQEVCDVLENCNYRGDYFQITFRSRLITPGVKAGQFVHIQLPDMPHLTLRRPFSVFDASTDEGTLSVIYKVVGAGSTALAAVERGKRISLLGPLGNGFPATPIGRGIIIVAGGYGCASTYLIARGAAQPGVCLLGARNKADILVEDAFAATGFRVHISTDDGSCGHQGLVTELLDRVLTETAGASPVTYACGPNAMLDAVADMCLARDIEAYLSYDMNMCCGVGACFTCVMKRKADNADGWEYVRTCRDGPVIDAREVYREDGTT